jgi:hypothetical protein
VLSFNQFMTGVVMGVILIIIGFVPGLLDKWAEALSNIAETILYRAPSPRATAPHSASSAGWPPWAWPSSP